MTMWLAAVDERVKAAMPFIRVGTFESYIMRSNCICELLVDGLTFTEEAGVLALIAPRALKICNHYKDDNPTFYPSEMLRSYNNARPIFEMLGAGNNISYQLFDYPHGYFPADQSAAIGWFNFHLKGIGTGDPVSETPFNLVPDEKLKVFPDGVRDPRVNSTAEYCKREGTILRNIFLGKTNFKAAQKKKDLSDILRVNEKSVLKSFSQFPGIDGWDRFALESSDGKLIPILHLASTGNSNDYVIICNPLGKKGINADLLNELIVNGKGIVIVDLSGTGEALSSESIPDDQHGKLHTLARAELWLGKTIPGEWVKELDVVTQFLSNEYNVSVVSIDGTKDTGLAALFFAVLQGENVKEITLRDAPVSYLFDSHEGLDFFSLAINLPGFLEWGDISLLAALSGRNINFINPVTISGKSINENSLKEFRSEYENLREICKQPGHTFFQRIF